VRPHNWTNIVAGAALAIALASPCIALAAATPAPQTAPTPAPLHGLARCTNEFVQYSASLGDDYSNFANDGEDATGSYDATAALTCGAYAAKFETRVSHYVTENDGPGTQTLFCTLDGGFASVPYFTATESTSDLRLERSIGRAGISAGLAWVTTGTNYGCPHLSGLGAGVEKLPSPSRGPRFYGSIFYYPSAAGSYRITQPTSPNFGRTLHPSYNIVLADVGVVWNVRDRGPFLYFGYGDEVRMPNGGALCLELIRSSPYAGIGVRLGSI
jgi:hypothetical protein